MLNSLELFRIFTFSCFEPLNENFDSIAALIYTCRNPMDTPKGNKGK